MCRGGPRDCKGALIATKTIVLGGFKDAPTANVIRRRQFSPCWDGFGDQIDLPGPVTWRF